jgi:glycine/D-amino acid oxidase-like deaminating enzyme
MDGMHHTPIAPLHVEIDGVGKYAEANTVEDLAALLTSLEWPDKRPREFHRALVSSFDALDHVIEPASARQAFVNAAHAAGMHVLPDDVAELKKAG